MDWLGGGCLGRKLTPENQFVHDQLAEKINKEKQAILAQADVFKNNKHKELTGSAAVLNKRKDPIRAADTLEAKIEALKGAFNLDDDHAWAARQTDLYSGNWNSYFHPDEFEKDQQAPYKVNEPQATTLGRLFDTRQPDKNQLFTKDKADLDNLLSSKEIDEETYNAKLDGLVTTKHQGEMQGDHPEYSSSLEYRRGYAKLHSSLDRGDIDSIEFQEKARALEDKYKKNKKDVGDYISGYNDLTARSADMHPDKHKMLLSELRDRLPDDNPRVSREVARKQKGQDNFLKDYLRDYKTTTTADYDERVSALPTNYNPLTWGSGSPAKQKLAKALKQQQDKAAKRMDSHVTRAKADIDAHRHDITDLSR